MSVRDINPVLFGEDFKGAVDPIVKIVQHRLVFVFWSMWSRRSRSFTKLMELSFFLEYIPKKVPRRPPMNRAAAATRM